MTHLGERRDAHDGYALAATVTEQSGEAIANALSEARGVLSRVVDVADELFGTANGADITEAWPEARDYLDALIRLVGVVEEDVFERVGLAGTQACGKIAGLRRSGRIFGRAVARNDWRLGRKLYVRFAGWLNSLLGSLLKEIPVAGELLKEFKERLENVASDRILEEEERDAEGADEVFQDLELGDEGF